jgi:hypothetical protein
MTPTYITVDDIHERLSSFAIPDGEAFFMRRSAWKWFSVVGATFKDTVVTFFDVYTGDRETYACIQKMFREAVARIGVPVEIEEWDEDQGSDTPSQISRGTRGGGYTGDSAVA